MSVNLSPTSIGRRQPRLSFLTTLHFHAFMILARKSTQLARPMEARACPTMGRVIATWNRLDRLSRSYRARTHVRVAGSGVC